MTYENDTFYRIEESPEASPFELSTYKHSSDRPYKCQFPECLSSFKTLSNLYKHNKIHNK